jgi:uncharacterized protein (DUF1697 family)
VAELQKVVCQHEMVFAVLVLATEEEQSESDIGGKTMPVYVALYRGINVSGKNIVKMEALRAMHERLGHRGVKNYIQSGNIVFAAKGSADAMSRKVAAEFAKDFGFAARLLVVDAERLVAIVNGNPYAKIAAEKPATVHAGICDGEPSMEGVKALFAKYGKSESYVIGDRIIYLHSPDGFGTSKFAAGMERASGVPMTVRNWRTIETLLQMANNAR